MNLELELSIMLAVVGAIPGVRAAFNRLLSAETEIMARRNRVILEDRQSRAALRSAARWSLTQQRNTGEAIAKSEAIERKTAELCSELAALRSRPQETRWILEGSMRQLVGRYLFKVSASDPVRAFGRAALPAWTAESWRRGRLILIGAVSVADARRRLDARFADKNGFKIESLG